MKNHEALMELDDAIEAVFYAAGLLRSSGDSQAAQRIGDIGDKLYDERLRLGSSKKRMLS